MTRNKRFTSIFAVATMTIFCSVAAMAHSAHDHSTVPYKWALSKNLKEKNWQQAKLKRPYLFNWFKPFSTKKSWDIMTSRSVINSILKLTKLIY